LYFACARGLGFELRFGGEAFGGGSGGDYYEGGVEVEAVEGEGEAETGVAARDEDCLTREGVGWG